MLWGMDDDYHHLQTRKLKFSEMKCLAHGCTDLHMPMLLKSEVRQFWCQSPSPTRSHQHHSIWSSTILFTHLPLFTESSQLLKSSDSLQLSGCDTARVKRSPCLSEIRPSPTAWAVTRVRHLSLWPAGQSRASHPPRSWEDDISRQSYSRKSQQQRCPPTSTAGEHGRGWGPGPGWLQTQGLQPPGGSWPELGTSPALAFGVLRLKEPGGGLSSRPRPSSGPGRGAGMAWSSPHSGGWGLRALHTGWTGAWASWQSISSPWNLDAWGYWIWTSVGLIYHLCFPNFYILLILFWEMTNTIALNV